MSRPEELFSDCFNGCPQSLQTNAGILHQIMPKPRRLHFTFFPIHYLLIIVLFDATQAELLTMALIELEIKQTIKL